MNWNAIQKQVQNHDFTYTEDYLKIAAELLNDDFTFIHVYNMEPSPITYHLTDWFTSPNGDPEWIYVLNRQEYLQDLLFAYFYTEDEQYLQKAKEFIFTWITKKYLDESVRYSSWRTIDTGIRLLNWSPMINLMLQKAMLSDEEQTLLKEAVNQQAQYLQDNYIEKYDLSNWGVLITTGVLTFAGQNPGLIADNLVKWAEERFATELQIQVDSDGMHWEQSPLYFIEVFRSSVCVLAVRQSMQLDNTEELRAILQKMLHSLHYQVLPNGELLQQGDTDAIAVQDLILASENIIMHNTNRHNLDFLVSIFNDPVNELDTEKNVSFPPTFDANISGNFFVKDERDNYLHLFNGKIGSGHGHASNGHLDLTIAGHNILVDPGRQTYVDNDLRYQLKSASSHNVVLLDQKYPIEIKDSWKFSKVLTNLANEVSHRENYDAYKLLYSDPETSDYVCRYVVVNRRHFTTIIIDVVKSQTATEVANNFVLSPEITEIQKLNNYLVLNDSSTRMYFDSQAADIEIAAQPYSKRYNEVVDTTKIIKKQKFSGYGVTYTVIGNELPQVEQLEVLQAGQPEDLKPENCFALRVSYADGTTDDLILQHLNTFKGNKLFYAGGHASFGELNLFQQDGTKTFLF